MMCFCFKQKTAYGWRISDWNSDVCSSDLPVSSLDPLPLLLFYAMGYEFGRAPFAVIEISIEALQRRSPTITVSRPRRLRLSVADIQLHFASDFLSGSFFSCCHPAPVVDGRVGDRPFRLPDIKAPT